MSIHTLLRLALLRLSSEATVRGCRQIDLGRGVRIGRGTLLDARGGPVCVGDGAWIGREATVLTDDPIRGRAKEATLSEPYAVTIGPDAWLGPRCLLMPGARIGAGAIVAAEAVVVGEVAPRAIVAGAPARLIGWRRAGDCLAFRPNTSTPDTASGGKTADSTSP
jgi:acetyltransferase-like isoleucine patch superfamily enzyme